MTVTQNKPTHEIMDTDAMMVAFLREYGLSGARERARHHIGRCVEAGLEDDAAFWMRVSNQLENLASSDYGPGNLFTPSGQISPTATRPG
ncbi:hypothetical protein B0W47_17510 (plasmid) [Komagataeibacter nataicola]|uniref:Uncharacterized protein n=1 Tax=Komagataeibacter nataicola TaxID=265960 RepID=A0A9N7CCQ7_9PROT|nr:hypothetical protein [Komagataeibacter nataicola]AQU89336.1 hypothetical protein B0W47_17385 [Komagataeibacter nataicola]AQU89350.1 hypothetical protein B0W47_17510 [Komagataeibacter nataicola]PYD65013.1 hypothetical protein CDI09_16055 [Komagataeibacter nataicola]WNM10236.1 hypothetical protein RI056_18195 [Komagataeibacter nataicola]GBR21384.1 hypothetical protein AA0616_2023 [Komagataeibacter nataicola NRIC 0616]